MSQDTIKCPKCGEIIELSEVISKDIEQRLHKKYESEISEIKKQTRNQLAEKENEFEARLKREKELLLEKTKNDVHDSVKLEIDDLKEQLKEKVDKLDEANRNELNLRKRQRELEEKEKQSAIQFERKLDEERKSLADKITQDLEERNKLKDAEKDKQLDAMRKQIDELKRKAEQGSQQMQGEVLELELEQLLKSGCPQDNIIPVPKGVRGGDVEQIVKSNLGKTCGKILWETKRTKNWSDAWIEKLKTDMRNSNADQAVILSITLPEGITQFEQINGVWVSSISSALALAKALRLMLIQVTNMRDAQSGKNEKMDIMFKYLTGPQFKHRVEAIVDAFKIMKIDLDSERIVMEKHWAKREKQIEAVIMNTAGMYGDLEGVIGAALPQIKSLALPSDKGGE